MPSQDFQGLICFMPNEGDDNGLKGQQDEDSRLLRTNFRPLVHAFDNDNCRRDSKLIEDFCASILQQLVNVSTICHCKRGKIRNIESVSTYHCHSLVIS